MNLQDYIDKHFNGYQAAFARSLVPPIHRQQVTVWIKKGFIVVDDVLYSPRRKVSRTTKHTDNLEKGKERGLDVFLDHSGECFVQLYVDGFGLQIPYDRYDDYVKEQDHGSV